MNADLEHEFSRAIRFAKQDKPAAMLATLAISPRVQWGAAMVSWWGKERAHYEPYADGASWALIAPVVEQDELIDLAAIELPNQHLGLRIGLGHGLGLDVVERARVGLVEIEGEKQSALWLCERPLDWLRDPIDHCYLFKLAEVGVTFERVERIVCGSIEFAERVQSLLPPWQRERVVVP